MNWPKTGKFFTSVLVRHLNRSGVVELVGREPLMFAKVENGVTKSCQFFRRKNRKNAISGWNFPLFWAGSLVVRESRHWVTEFPTKTAEKEEEENWAWDCFSKVGVRIPFSVGNFYFFGRGKTNFLVLGGGYNFKTGFPVTVLGHIQACPTRFLAQKTFVILKKRWPNKKLFLGRPACIPECRTDIHDGVWRFVPRRSALGARRSGLITIIT